jgi:hypothetical protein
MRRYLIYAAVYGTIGICVGLAMAYVSKDGQPAYFSIVPKRKSNLVDLPTREEPATAVEVEEVPNIEEISE